MTREEREDVINFLKGYLDEEVYTEKCRNAHEMAIKSLEKEPCEDAISREAAIDACNQSVNILEATDRIKDLSPVYPEAKECVDESSSENLNKWIPVSERLPEEHNEVLTCSLGGFIEIQSYEDSYGGYWEDQKGDWSDMDEVIAWMPLPERY